jgi:hypothetical protein
VLIWLVSNKGYQLDCPDHYFHKLKDCERALSPTGTASGVLPSSDIYCKFVSQQKWC